MVSGDRAWRAQCTGPKPCTAPCSQILATLNSRCTFIALKRNTAIHTPSRGFMRTNTSLHAETACVTLLVTLLSRPPDGFTDDNLCCCVSKPTHCLPWLRRRSHQAFGLCRHQQPALVLGCSLKTEALPRTLKVHGHPSRIYISSECIDGGFGTALCSSAC